MMPLLWAIGFVTGHVMFVPLGVRLLSKLFIVDIINRQLFVTMSNSEFTLAFGSGMVLAGTITGMLNTPAVLYKAFKQLRFSARLESKKSLFKTIMSLETTILIGLIITFLTYFNFSLIAQLYLIIFTFICTYQMAVIAGKIGLAQLGRFATFVMVPAIFLFNINYIQIMLLATFVEICWWSSCRCFIRTQNGISGKCFNRQNKKLSIVWINNKFFNHWCCCLVTN